MEYRTVNPTTEELVERFATATDDALASALVAAWSAFGIWSREPLAARARVLLRAAELLDSEAPQLARLMALEMGKPLGEGAGEIGKCAWACRFYAEHAAAFLEPEARPADASEAFVRFDPLGPVLAIMPWNFPFWQFFRFAAPSLMAGNVVLLKHAPNTPACALRIESLLQEAGLPGAVVQNLFLTHEQAAKAMADARVRGVTLTGSSRAGRQVASTAGGQLKTTVLELGGSDPFIVLDDADLERAVEVGVLSRCLNSGQSCIAAKRFLVQTEVFDEFCDRFVAAMQARTVGDPTDPRVDLGPLARRDLRERLDEQVRGSIAAGAKVLCGGDLPDRRGFFYPATVLIDPQPASPATSEELFGPVATLFRVRGDEQAVAVANDSEFGLGASLWTTDRQRAERLIPRIESGAVFVNGLVKSDPRLPFGGVKSSGFGRELGREGMLEFVNRKTVWIA